MDSAGAPEAGKGIFKHEIRVGWGDCDPARIAYVARLPHFALEAIDAWWERHFGGEGWYQLNLDRNLGTPFVHMSLDFHAPVTPRHKLQCLVWPTRLGESSIEMRVDALQDGKLCFEGRFVSVFVIADAFRRRPAPKSIRDVIAPLIIPDSAK